MRATTAPALLLSSAVLLANFIFLTVSVGCSFAVIKRGIFIVTRVERGASNVDVEWETFLRVNPKRFGWLAWNTDNLYLVPIFLVVVGLSLAIFVAETRPLLATADKTRLSDYALLAVPMALHEWPAWSFWQLARLMQDQTRLLGSLRELGDSKP